MSDTTAHPQCPDSWTGHAPHLIHLTAGPLTGAFVTCRGGVQ